MLTVITRLLIALLETNKNQNKNKTKNRNIGNHKYNCNNVISSNKKIITVSKRSDSVKKINYKDIE